MRDFPTAGVLKDVNKAANGRATTKKENIMSNTLLILASTAVLLTAVHAASAADPSLSPRAKASQSRTVSGATDDKLDRSIKPGSPRAIARAESLRKVPKTGAHIDLAHGPHPLLSPKDPRYETTIRELRGIRGQSAPAK